MYRREDGLWNRRAMEKGAMSAKDDIEKVRQALWAWCAFLPYEMANAISKKAILVTLDLLLGETAGTATGAYIKAKRAEIKDAK